MSFDSTRIHCTGCDYEYWETYRPAIIKCRFGSGEVRYSKARAWCHTCQRITEAEYLPTVEEITEEFALDLYSESNGFKRFTRWFSNKYHISRKEYKNKIAWRKARTEPAHCLTCGLSDLELLEFTPTTEYEPVSPPRQTMYYDIIQQKYLERGPWVFVVAGFRHSCGGQLIHDRTDTDGVRFFWGTTLIWMDLSGRVLKKEPYEGKLRRRSKSYAWLISFKKKLHAVWHKPVF